MDSQLLIGPDGAGQINGCVLRGPTGTLLRLPTVADLVGNVRLAEVDGSIE